MAMAQSAPDYMILDRFVFRRDDETGFPAPFMASSCTSLGQRFEVAFFPANPPAVSRFHVRWPGGTKPEEGSGTDLVAAYRDLLLLRLTSVEHLEQSPYIQYTQDHFICKASSEPEGHLQLKRLPVCREQVTIPPSEGEEEQTVLPYVFFSNAVGLIQRFVNGGDDEEFFVAQLGKVSPIPDSMEMMAEVCLLRSRLSCDDGDGMWEVKKIRIQHKASEYDDLWFWSTDHVVTFKDSICWVDYGRGGILFYDVLNENPTISYLRLNINNRSTGPTYCQTLPGMNRSLCVTREGNFRNAVLTFIDIVRSDGCIFGPFELGSGFTISSSIIWSLDGEWVEVENVKINSEDLWYGNTSSGLPHELLMFPLASMQNANEVHFLVEEKKIKKVSMVTLNMIEKEVLSVVPYIVGGEGGDDADIIKEKTHLLTSFISSRFPLYLKSKPVKPEELAWRFPETEARAKEERLAKRDRKKKKQHKASGSRVR